MITPEEAHILRSMYTVLNNNRLAIEAIAISSDLDKAAFATAIKRDADKLMWFADKLVGNIKEAER